jgi:hypothetical protein
MRHEAYLDYDPYLLGASDLDLGVTSQMPQLNRLTKRIGAFSPYWPTAFMKETMRNVVAMLSQRTFLATEFSAAFLVSSRATP